MKLYKTFSAKKASLPRRWFVADATDIPLGRLASQVAAILRGKHRPEFTPHTDCGDGVIIVNCAKVKLTGRKLEQKSHFHHTGWPGGQRLTPYKQLMQTRPERAVQWAVKGMLPHTRLGARQILHLKVYKGATHPHEAQEPKPLAIVS